MNLISKIQSQFGNNPELKVLFFFDHEKEYSEEITSLEIEEIKIMDAEKSHFSLKVQLENELFNKSVVLYFPYAKPSSMKDKNKFILYDILTANKELLLDDEADFMDEYSLLPHHRSLVRRYIKELKLKKHQTVLAKILNQQQFEENKVIQGLICSHLGFQTIVDPTLILSRLFILTLPENKANLDKFIKKIQLDDFRDAVLGWIYTFLGITSDKVTQELLMTAVRKLKYNLLVQHINDLKGDDPYIKLRINDMMTLQMTNSIMVDWQNHPKLTDEIDNVFLITGNAIKENIIVELYGSNSDYLYYTEELKILILSENIKLIEHHPQKVSKLLQAISGYGNDSEELIVLVRYLGYVSQYFHYLNSIKTYILDTPEEYVTQYSEMYYQIDFSYRKTVSVLQSLEKMNLHEAIHLDALNKSLHKSYENYMIELNRQWMKCMEQFGFKFNDIKVGKQNDFYSEYLKDNDQKVAVIISDALRYESAEELLGELLGDPKGNASISYLLAGIPSITKWGMANLLTDNSLTYADTKITINGMSTDGTVNRQKVLKTHTKDAAAYQYEKIIKMEQDDARGVFKKSMVFIYHNVIDAIGDDRKSEMKTFDAVDTAISDLKNLVKKIHSSYNVSRVLITSDHGFLFNYRELPEAIFQKKPPGKHIEEHNRYTITKSTKDIKDSYVMNLSDTANVESDLKVVVPKAINRYKRQGSGMHFVHGGGSLQELIVPVIESNRKREDVSMRVPFKLLNKDYKIVSGAIKIRIFQELPVGVETKAREVVAGLYTTTNELVSNEVQHTMDSASELPTERTKEFILNINSQSGQDEIMVLKMFDTDDNDRLNPLVSEKVFNKTLIESDF